MLNYRIPGHPTGSAGADCGLLLENSAGWVSTLCTDSHPVLCAIKNACYGTPCQYGGTCHTTSCSTTGAYYCQCTSAYTGANCETPMRERRFTI